MSAARGRVSSGAHADLVGRLGERERRPTLRFITCGSVDDGKSTLLGRMLYDSGKLYRDELAALESDSANFGTQGDNLDFALLLDGLRAEREQAITIDVAYRYFATERRHYIVADTPGHEQYTRNMVTAASTADAAVILVDARKGLLTQSRRHAYIAALIGIRDLVLVVNKLDLVDWSADAFNRIAAAFRAFVEPLGIHPVTSIPISALLGDNVASSSDAMPWYRGPTLLGHLETIDAAADRDDGPFRMPVQWVNRPDPDFRGYSGRIVGGTVRAGDRIRALPSGKETSIARIVAGDGDRPAATAGESVTLTLADAIDVSRGDMLAAAGSPPEIADQFEAVLIWMSDHELLPGRPYLLKIGPRTVGATVGSLKYRVNVDTLEHLASKTLELNEIGLCNVVVDEPIAFEPYSVNRDTGGFILIDRMTNDTIAAGLLHFALRRAHNIHWQAIDIDKRARAALKGQRPCVVWFTGLSGSGKSTIANALEKKLHALGRHTYLLDGDNVRHGLSKDLGFTDADRVENIRRVAQVARLMVDAGLIVLVSFISPFRAERRLARGLVEDGEFCEVFVDAPLAVAEARDAKGLYAKARRGELAHFTGIDSPYEPPEHAEVRIDTVSVGPADAADLIVTHLRAHGVLEKA